MSAKQADPEFIVFDTPEMGIRALAKVLLNYRRKHGLKTVRGIIGRWAPPNENDTLAYAKAVAKALGVTVDQPIDMEDRDVMQTLVTAIIRHENGEQPYSHGTIRDAIALAFEP